VNMAKSKIVVFRRGGRLGEREKWYYGNEVIETVNEYRYLRVVFSSRLALTAHFKCKITAARFGINSVWRRLILNDEAPLSMK